MRIYFPPMALICISHTLRFAVTSSKTIWLTKVVTSSKAEAVSSAKIFTTHVTSSEKNRLDLQKDHFSKANHQDNNYFLFFQSRLMHVFPGFVTPYIQKFKLLSPTKNLSPEHLPSLPQQINSINFPPQVPKYLALKQILSFFNLSRDTLFFCSLNLVFLKKKNFRRCDCPCKKNSPI